MDIEETDTTPVLGNHMKTIHATESAKPASSVTLADSVNQIRSSGSQTYKEMVNQFELALINSYIQEYGSVKKAAEILSVHPSLIWRKLHDAANKGQ